MEVPDAPAAQNGASEKKRAALRKEIAKAKTALEQEAEKSARLEKEAAGLRSELEAARSTLAEETERVNGLEAAAARRTASAIFAAHEGKAELENRVATLREQVVALERVAAEAAAEVERWQGDHQAAVDRNMHGAADIADEVERLRDEMERLRAENEQLRAAPATPPVDVEPLRGEVERLRVEMERLRAENEQLRAAPATPPVDVEPLRDEIERLHAALARESERRARLERDVKDLREAWSYDLARKRMELTTP